MCLQRGFLVFSGMSGMKLYEIMGFSRTVIMALDFGAPSFRVKTKTRQKISKPSHHLPSSPIISHHLPSSPIYVGLIWSGGIGSLEPSLKAADHSQLASRHEARLRGLSLGSAIPPAGKPAGCSSSEHNEDFLDSLTLFGTCETCHKTHGFS